ncbi:MAG: hypothetical protein JWN65_2829 [Solirubrobacterales bacterium]|jgi:hypothetical protein|nr:hypothetical protein [Solirubrobacterales bacterium]
MSTQSIARARLTVSCGPLARPLASRLVMSVGAETDLPVDRVSEAAMIAETVVELCGEVAPDGFVELTVRADERLLELRAGPLQPGGGQRLLGSDAGNGSGGVLRALATQAVVRQGRDGVEVLVLTVGEHP